MLDVNVSKCFKVTTCCWGQPGAPIRLYRLIHFNPVDSTKTKSIILWFELTPHIYAFENADSNTKPWVLLRDCFKADKKEKKFRF